MNFGAAAVLVAILSCTVLSSVEAARKSKKSSPQWKSTSMPFRNRRIVSDKEGKNIKLDCKVQGHPKPNIKWMRNGVPIRKSTPNIVLKKFGLMMENTSAEMSGNYSCMVKNKHGSLEWTFMVDIMAQIWPLVVEGPKNITQMVGSNVAFQCRILNDPKATIRWQRVFKKHDKARSVFLLQGDEPEILMLENIKESDAGEYRCMAGNLNGLKYSSAFLTVIEPVLKAVVPTSFPDKDEDSRWQKGNGNRDNDGDDSGQGVFDKDNERDLFAFGRDRSYSTTKRPRNKNNNGRKKNKKNKGKKKNKTPRPRFDTTPFPTLPSSSTPTDSTPSSSSLDYFGGIPRTTKSNIWTYDQVGGNDEYEGFTDYRSNRGRDDGNNYNGKGDGEPQGEAKNVSGDKSEYDISAWKIYTIVGAVGGAVLLVGLVAITIALCCPKQEGGVYKSTPV